jgi:hypothetical protein
MPSKQQTGVSSKSSFLSCGLQFNYVGISAATNICITPCPPERDNSLFPPSLIGPYHKNGMEDLEERQPHHFFQKEAWSVIGGMANMVSDGPFSCNKKLAGSHIHNHQHQFVCTSVC